MFSVFLSTYRNTRESLGEFEKAEKKTSSSNCTVMADSVQWLNQTDCSICISILSSRILLKLDRNTVHVFYYLNIKHESTREGREGASSDQTRGGYRRW